VLEIAPSDFVFAASRRRITISLLAGTLNCAGGFIDPQFAGEETLRLPEMRARQLTILRDFDQRYNTFGRSDSVISDPCGFTFHIVSASSIICP
jgi:hypothetical protein